MVLFATLMVGTHNKALGPRIQEWNEKLMSQSKQFNELHDDVDIAIFDAFGIFNDVLDHHEQHGLKDITSICYEDECAWYDHIHPTAHIHEILASGLLNLLAS